MRRRRNGEEGVVYLSKSGEVTAEATRPTMISKAPVRPAAVSE